MVRTLYVGNLPWSITEQELADAFSAHGQVFGSRIVTDRGTGRSRGFGFVEVNDADTDKIISATNGMELGNRSITVNEARERA